MNSIEYYICCKSLKIIILNNTSCTRNIVMSSWDFLSLLKAIIVLSSFEIQRSGTSCTPPRGLIFMVHGYGNDISGKPRLATVMELLRVTDYLGKKLHDLSVPFLVLHRSADVVTDPEVSRELYSFKKY